MNIHIISIGGSVMHQLAINLKNQGHNVTGSDDEIYNPSRSSLEDEGLLPEKMGWMEHNIHDKLDAVILGMHAKKDNPELIKAQNKGLKIYSYPEFIYEVSKDKKRIVVGGSHGKTTTTSMIMHILKDQGVDFDYLVGAKVEGFSSSVKLSDAPIIVIEGDEYLSSPIDKRSKFLHYKPHVAIITGVAWDHINVFPTYELYEQTFLGFMDGLSEETSLFVFNDPTLLTLAEKSSHNNVISYDMFPHDQQGVIHHGEHYEMNIFGDHNYSNLQAAYNVCRTLGILPEAFLRSAQSYVTPDKRMNILHSSEQKVVIRDFAHAPSKVEATVKAVADKYPDNQLFVLLELHTFSSLDKSFLPFYKGTLLPAHQAIVTYSPKTLEIKKLEPIEPSYINQCFDSENVKTLIDRQEIQDWMREISTLDRFTLLIMSSGHLAGLNIDEIVSGI